MAAAPRICVWDPRAHPVGALHPQLPSSSSGSTATGLDYPPYLSAGGGLQATRLVAASEERAYFASHAHIYEVQLNYPTDDDGGDDDDEAAAATKPRAAQTPFARVRLGRLAAPAAASAGVSRKPGEIQSLALLPPSCGDGPATLAGVDALQGLLIHRLDDDDDSKSSSSSPSPSPTYLPFRPPGGGSGCGEFAGFAWAGLAADPSRPGYVATVRAYGKTLAFTDLGAAATTQQEAAVNVHTLWQPPAALAYLPTAASYNPLLAVAEGPAFSLWDPRTPHACIAREQPNPPTRLHALASLRLPGGDADPALVVAGDDGVLVVYDLRCLGAGGGKGSRGGGGVGGATTTLRARARWRSAVKHDVVALLAAPSSVLYGAGLDSELLPCVLPPALADGGGGKGKGKKRRLDGEGEAGEGGTGQPPPQPQQQWGQTQASHAPLPATSRLHEAHHASMRGDARWVGVALAPGGTGSDGKGDTILGVSDRGTLYAVRHAESLGSSWRLGADGGGGGGGGGD